MAKAATVTMKGNPLVLTGQVPRVGDRAPVFTAVANDLSVYSFPPAEANAVHILLSVPSLDTGVCDTETRRFNKEAESLGKDVKIVVVSMDLPFAQKRWCGAAGVSNVQTVSDHKDASFGHAYGALLADLRLLARAVFVVGRDGKIKYEQLVGEIASEPDYDAALAAAKAAING